MARLEKICIKATKAIVKKVKMVIEKTQFIKVKKAATIQDNTMRTFTKKREKDISKKRKLNEMFDT